MREHRDLEFFARRDGIAEHEAIGHVEPLDRGRARPARCARQDAVDPHLGIIVDIHGEHRFRARRGETRNAFPVSSGSRGTRRTTPCRRPASRSDRVAAISGHAESSKPLSSACGSTSYVVLNSGIASDSAGHSTIFASIDFPPRAECSRSFDRHQIDHMRRRHQRSDRRLRHEQWRHGWWGRNRRPGIGVIGHSHCPFRWIARRQQGDRFGVIPDRRRVLRRVRGGRLKGQPRRTYGRTASSNIDVGARRGPSPSSTGGTIVTPHRGNVRRDACAMGWSSSGWFSDGATMTGVRRPIASATTDSARLSAMPWASLLSELKLHGANSTTPRGGRGRMARSKYNSTTCAPRTSARSRGAMTRDAFGVGSAMTVVKPTPRSPWSSSGSVPRSWCR